MLLIILAIFILSSCGTSSTTSLVLTPDRDKTVLSQAEHAILKTCHLFGPESDPTLMQDSYCDAVRNFDGDHPHSLDCKAGVFSKRYEKFARFYQDQVLRHYNFDDNEEAKTCVAQLSEFFTDMIVGDLEAGIKKGIPVSLPNIEQEDPDCWTLTSVDGKGHVTAETCLENRVGEVSLLPLEGSAVYRKSSAIKLKHEKLSRIHAIKDPTDALSGLNNPFLHQLSNKSQAPHITYGPANCHGTAHALVTTDLDRVEIEKLDYHSPNVKEECGSATETLFAKIKESKGRVLANDLPFQRGGHVINMNHKEDTCSISDGGEVSFFTYSCKDKSNPIAYIFHSNMCVNYWGKKLEDQGLVPATRGGELRPGCVMTQSDHSITILMRSQGMCYHYESASPFAAPQLRVAPCDTLSLRFKKAWCPTPDQSLKFEFVQD